MWWTAVSHNQVDDVDLLYHCYMFISLFSVSGFPSFKEHIFQKLMIKTLNLKLVIMLEYQNTKTFLIKDILRIGLKKLKILFHGHMLLIISMVKKLLKHFMKKNYKKTNQQGFRIEKVIKRKGNKLYVKWKGYGNSFNSWIDKNDLV